MPDTIPQQQEINQCDGCRRGLPLNEHGYHYNPDRDWDFIGCTAFKYGRKPLPPDDEEYVDTRQD